MVKWLTRSVLALVMVTAVMAIGSHVTHADQRDFTVINGNSAAVLLHFYVAPSAPDDDWGDDVLGRDVLNPGESASILFSRFNPDQCTYDLRAVYTDGTEGQLLNIDLCSTLTVTFNTGG